MRCNVDDEVGWLSLSLEVEMMEAVSRLAEIKYDQSPLR